MITKLYQLTFEQLSEIESNLIDVWLRDTTKPEERKAIVAAVASCILVCDLVAIVTAAQDKFAGGGGGYTKPRSVVSGCLSHKNSQKKCGWCDQYDSIEKTCLNKVRRYIPVPGMDFMSFHYQFWQTPIDASCPEWEKRHPDKPVPKIPEKKSSISEMYEALGKRIHTMLYSMDEITLDEEQWADSYDLHINHRNSRTSSSTMRGKS